MTRARSKPEQPSQSQTKPFDPVEFSRKFMNLVKQAQPIIQEAAEKYRSNFQGPSSQTSFDPLNIAPALAEFWGYYLRHPSQLVEHQMTYLENIANLWQEAATRFLTPPDTSNTPPLVADRRFRDPVWSQNALFDFLKRSYFLTRDAVQHTLDADLELSSHDRQKLEFLTRQMFDAAAPNNFVLTNPEVIRETLQTGGENLLKGLENLIHDIKQGAGELKITTTRAENFVLGKNLAATPGRVVFKNRMMELIMYIPTTPQVAQTPLLIIPPWINKYYILDLRADNSLVKFALDHGQTVFMISWINPDASYKDVLFDDYLIDGVIAALNQIDKICGTKRTNAVGYCIGGTLLAITLAYLTAKHQGTRISSATFLTTLLDFDQAGDMKVFIDESQLNALEKRMKTQGYMDAQALQKTFALLRANDMVWSFVINNYMLGRTPFPFDILYWNNDSTNLPAAFHAYYLRHMYLRNDLIKPNKLTMGGIKIDLHKIKTPCYFLSTREDHIAPWTATFSGAKLLDQKTEVTFVLAASGHVAGVVNPPSAQKYGYWTRDTLDAAPDVWVESAQYTDGSWWNHWANWVGKYQGGKSPARTVPQGLSDAPGTYVRGGKF